MIPTRTPWPVGDDGMAARIRAFAWDATPLGPIARWPQSLRTVVALMLASPGTMCLVWGADAIHLYNDGFAELLREQDADALGRSAYETFARFREVFADDLAAGMAGGSARRLGQPYPLLRHGRVEEAWFDVDYAPLRDETDAVAGVLWTLRETTARVVAERALRESEERQAFLLGLSDAVRTLAVPAEIMAAVSERVGRHLGVGRCGYGEVPPPYVDFVVERDWTDGVMESLQGVWPLESFGTAMVQQHRRGETVVVENAFADLRSRGSEAGFEAAGHVTSSVAAQLVKGGVWVATFYVQNRVPRRWTASEVALIEDIAERTWSALERARAEAALTASEARFRQFASASASALWVRNAQTRDLEYASPALAAIYGVEPDALLGDVRRWAATIVPEDRDAALERLEAACGGETVAHEFRIQRPDDGSFRWIRSTDFPLGDDGIGGITEDITERRQLAVHRGVLLAELQHRVRNIMGLIRSMANRAAPGAGSVEAYRVLMEGRLLALTRVQVLLTRGANAGGSLRGIIESEVGPQAHHPGQLDLCGADLHLSPKAVEVLSLAFHELATNAVKYGALSVPEGRLTVSWTVTRRRDVPWLELVWTERGAPPREPATRRGFGSELIEARIPYELGGRGSLAIGPQGAQCSLELPLSDRASVLETDAPQPATVFGGDLDMTGARDLTGRTVLVVEDDYYMASDAAAALRGAGAAVLGPCPSAEATQDLLADARPTHAVVDLNLDGGGPRFEIARLLKARGIPFVFLTGYDPDVIPEDLTDIVRLQKPLPFRTLVEAVGQL